jgi:predicted dinucleotide-binding enzyme
MFALRIIEHLDVVENILPCVVSGFVNPEAATLALQEVEGAFCDRVVVTDSAAAQAVFEIVVSQQ